MSAFETAARDALAFLGPDRQLRPSALATFALDGERRRSQVAASEVQYPFLATLEFTGANPPVRLSFGEREYHLELEIAANGSGYFPIETWLDALGIDFESADNSGVASPTALARHARGLARQLRDHFDDILAADEKVVGRLNRQGAKSPARLNRTRDRAHAAFAEGRYDSYVELLEPFEDALTVTERRKLEFARGKAEAA